MKAIIGKYGFTGIALIPSSCVFALFMLFSWFILLHESVFPSHLVFHLFGVEDYAQRSLGYFWNFNHIAMWFGIFAGSFIVGTLTLGALLNRFGDQEEASSCPAAY